MIDHKVAEVCPYCDGENIYEENTIESGNYIATCKHCKKEIFLCDECLHADDNTAQDCDWREENGCSVCKRGKIDNNKKVWLVLSESVYECNGSRTTVDVFSTYEKAKERFDAMVKEEKENDDLMNCDDTVVEEDEDSFSIYSDGCYTENHCDIWIVGRKIQ